MTSTRPGRPSGPGHRTGVLLLAPLFLGSAIAAAALPECEPIARPVALPDALSENSGLAVSRARPGVVWTHTDSGGEDEVYAVTFDGRLAQTVEVRGADNEDWEDLALGDCGPGFDFGEVDDEAADEGRSATPRDCLWIADLGDNAERRDAVHLYRFLEPGPEDDQVRADEIEVTFPDGPRDVEAFFLLPGGEPAVVTKGRNHPPTLYRAGPGWQGGDLRFEEVQRFGSRPRLPDVMITGADAMGQGEDYRVAIRSYSQLGIFTWDGSRLTVVDEGTVELRTLREPQGEAVAWIPAGTPTGLRGGEGEAADEGPAGASGRARLLLSSEARGFQPPGMLMLGCAAVW